MTEFDFLPVSKSDMEQRGWWYYDFLVVSGDSVRMLPAQSLSVADRMVELLPGVVEDVKHMFLKPAPGQGGAQ